MENLKYVTNKTLSFEIEYINFSLVIKEKAQLACTCSIAEKQLRIWGTLCFLI